MWQDLTDKFISNIVVEDPEPLDRFLGRKHLTLSEIECEKEIKSPSRAALSGARDTCSVHCIENHFVVIA
eukprot:3675808-Karenia_brevis.AAC.1